MSSRGVRRGAFWPRTKMSGFISLVYGLVCTGSLASAGSESVDVMISSTSDSSLTESLYTLPAFKRGIVLKLACRILLPLPQQLRCHCATTVTALLYF